MGHRKGREWVTGARVPAPPKVRVPRYVRKGECCQCGGCCRMDMVAPSMWRRTEAAVEARIKEVGVDAYANPHCQALAWVCPHCGKMLSSTQAGWDCSSCAVTVPEPTTTICREHEKRGGKHFPPGCAAFPAHPLQLVLLQHRLVKSGKPRCTYWFEEVEPCLVPGESPRIAP